MLENEVKMNIVAPDNNIIDDNGNNNNNATVNSGIGIYYNIQDYKKCLTYITILLTV